MHAGAWSAAARGTVTPLLPMLKKLVPQGGFEPSTYRLRSDCSAVELLRRPQARLLAKKAAAVEAGQLNIVIAGFRFVLTHSDPRTESLPLYLADERPAHSICSLPRLRGRGGEGVRSHA
jgi:hypothetical protein